MCRSDELMALLMQEHDGEPCPSWRGVRKYSARSVYLAAGTADAWFVTRTPDIQYEPFRHRDLVPLLVAGLIESDYPESPTARNLSYHAVAMRRGAA